MDNDDGQVKHYRADMKRLAKNTVFLYLRQIIILLVSLYTARIVLQVLGAPDYGIYSVVGSFVSLFHVVSGAISVAISRYMTMAVGAGDAERLRSMYSTSVWLQILIGITILICTIIIGKWYIYNIMVLPSGREDAALVVLVFSALAFFVNLLSVPYNALIIAYEDMKAFAYIALAEAGMKLLIVILLQRIDYDHLMVYGALALLVSLSIRALYVVYCKRRYTECVFEFRIDKKLFWDMLGFIQWAFLGNGAVMVREHGISIILNFFCGTSVNAARGISNSVNSAVFSFTSNYIQAAQPQITKLFGTGERALLCSFICRCCRYSFFLMFLIGLPLIKNVDFVLSLWLGDYPAYTSAFIIWTLLDGMVNSVNQPMLFGTLAEGHIRAYEIMLTVLFVSSIPLSYGILSLDYSPVSVYVLLFVLRIGVFLALLQQSYLYGMDYQTFLGKVLVRLFVVSLLSGGFAYWFDLSGTVRGEFWRFVMETALILGVTGTIILRIGMDGQERSSLWGFVKGRLMAEVDRKG